MVKTAIYFWTIKETRLMLSQFKELNILKYADGGKNKKWFLSTTVMVCGNVGQLETSPYQLDNKSITLSYI